MLMTLVFARSNTKTAVAWLPPSTRRIARQRSVSYCQARNELLLPSSHFKKIQNVMAPMVAASDYAFRCLVERYGVDLTFTQMLHARNLVQDPMFRRNHLDFGFQDTLTQSQLDCIQGMTIVQQEHHIPGPLIVQLAGYDPEMIMRAFDVLMENECQFDGIDVNLGCPQAIARKGNYGAFLHEYKEDLVCDILQMLKRHVPSHYSVSCKIRLPVSLKDEDIQNRIQRLVDTGVNFITVHGRTLEENKTKTGAVHVDKLRLAVEMAGKVPVICNGGVESHADIDRLLGLTNAAAIMSSEALLETPNLFSTDSSQLSPRLLFQQQVNMAREYIDLCAIYPPLPGVLGGNGSFSIVKGHLFKILHRYLQQHVDIRNQLMCATRLVDGVAILDELQSCYQNQGDFGDCPSSQQDASWYRRHWAANNRVHQRKRHAQMLHPVQETVEQRKEEMKQRIAKLRKERLARQDKEESHARQDEEERLSFDLI